MGFNRNLPAVSCFLMFLVFGCAATERKIPIGMASVQPGTQVVFKGKLVNLNVA